MGASEYAIVLFTAALAILIFGQTGRALNTSSTSTAMDASAPMQAHLGSMSIEQYIQAKWPGR